MMTARDMVDRSPFINSDVHTVVQASAGTGKTHALMDRFMALALGHATGTPVPPDRILLITFTNKAAGELKRRITTLASKSDNIPSTPGAHLKLLQPAVFTYHGFALHLLRDHAPVIGYSPDFGILSQAEADMLLYGEATALLDEARRSGAPGLDDMLFRYRLDRLRDMLMRFYRNFTTFATVPGRQLAESFPGAADADAVMGELYRIAGADPKAEELLDRMTAAGQPGTLRGYEALDWWQDMHGTVNGRTKTGKAMRRVIEEAIAGYTGFIRDFMVHTVRRLDETYSARKRGLNVMEFSDLERLALDILTSDRDVARAWQNRFDAILVDEFQDTSKNQAELIRSLADPTGARPILSVVGDPKQSIYFFRGADVSSYNHLVRELETAGDNRVFHFRENFRSFPVITDYVNRVWGTVYEQYAAAADIGPGEALPYDAELDALDPRRDGDPDPWAGVSVGVFKPDQEQKKALGQQDRRLIEAHRLARSLRNIREANPALLWRDMAVLVRFRTGYSLLQQAFDAQGIPLHLSMAGNQPLHTDEGRDILAVLDWLLNPRDAFSLLVVLRSPFVALSDDELVALWLPDYGESLMAWLSDRTRHCPGMQGLPRFQVEILEQFRSLCNAARHALGLRPTWRILSGLVDDSGYLSAVSGYPDAHSRAAGMRRCIDLLKAAGAGGDVPELVRRRFAMGVGDGEAAVTGDDAAADGDDAVVAMTVHQSKGLQFKLVALYDMPLTSRKGNDGDIAWFPPDTLAVKGGGKVKGDAWETMQQNRRRQEEYEELRVLYVALTRAADCLLLNLWDMPAAKKAAGASLFNWHATLLQAGADTLPGIRVKTFEPKDIDGMQREATALPGTGKDTVAPQPLSAVALTPQQPPLKSPWIPRIALRNILSMVQCPRRTKLLYWRSTGMPGVESRLIEPFRQRLYAVADAGELSGIQLGELMHLTFEQWQEPVEDRHIPQRIRDAFMRSGLRRGLTASRVVEDLVQAMDRFLRSPFGLRLRRGIAGGGLRNEMPWELLLKDYGPNGLVLTGRMDAVLQDDEGLCIVDYKYGTVASPEHVSEEYLLQLYAYRMALSAAGGLPPGDIATALVFPMTGHPVIPCLADPRQEAKIAGIFEDLARRAAEEFPRSTLPETVSVGTCRRLRCGFIDMCHPDAAGLPSDAAGVEDSLRESADDTRE